MNFVSDVLSGGCCSIHVITSPPVHASSIVVYMADWVKFFMAASKTLDGDAVFALACDSAIGGVPCVTCR